MKMLKKHAHHAKKTATPHKGKKPPHSGRKHEDGKKGRKPYA